MSQICYTDIYVMVFMHICLVMPEMYFLLFNIGICGNSKAMIILITGKLGKEVR